jgi:UDP-N-acetylmuramate--alanine ligase
MNYHFIGIGGIGMSGLARILLEQGQTVTGSDMSASYVTDGLKEAGALVSFGHKKENVPDNATVIYSTDIPKDNPELVVAKEKNYPLLHRSDLLLSLMEKQTVIGVSGTHGKTTTTALLTHIFRTAGFDPAFAVGGVLCDLEINASFGRGGYFIAEADESDGTFLKYPVSGAIVTNIDNDHLAHYGSWQNLVEAFYTFIQKVKEPEKLIYCIDDPTLVSLGIKGTSYGFSEQADLRIQNFSQNGWQCNFDINQMQNIVCNLTGRHNALNATAATGIALAYGIKEEAIREALRTFKGVKRRLEKKAETPLFTVYDDYAHHPTEIRATLKALRQAEPNKMLIAIFQPHRYSRMRYVMKDFDNVFVSADSVIVTDLFTAKEEPVAGVSTESILHEIRKSCPSCHYMARASLAVELTKLITTPCTIVTMGAGDITKVAKELVEHVQRS